RQGFCEHDRKIPRTPSAPVFVARIELRRELQASLSCLKEKAQEAVQSPRPLSDRNPSPKAWKAADWGRRRTSFSARHRFTRFTKSRMACATASGRSVWMVPKVQFAISRVMVRPREVTRQGVAWIVPNRADA